MSEKYTDLSVASVGAISEGGRIALLRQFDISATSLIAKGTETEVYALDDTRVLKLYAGPDHLKSARTLANFYEMIDAGPSGLALPRIQNVIQIEDVVGVVESRIGGVSLEAMLAKEDEESCEKAERLYVSAVQAVGELTLLQQPTRYRLFDAENESSMLGRSWNSYYSGLLGRKIATVGALFVRSIARFVAKAGVLADAVRAQEEPRIAIVHGDLFPGNVMVRADLTAVSGVIDFGSLTLFGDHVLDIACAFGYYKMYAPDAVLVRQRMLPTFLNIVPTACQSRFFRYLLANALMTSDLYVTEANPLDNGHFQWATEILTDQEYWNRADLI